MNPLITVVIPNYNRADLLHETLMSIKKQSYFNWEVLVVDDGSIDGSLQVIQRFVDLDHRFYCIQRNRLPKGANTCRNIGLENATGDFVVFLDSDDLLDRGCLEHRIRKAHMFPEFDYWVFQVKRFHEQIEVKGDIWNIETKQNNLARFLQLDAVWHTTGPLWRTNQVRQINGFDERLDCLQDVDFHVRAIANGLCGKLFLNEAPDAFYRQHNRGSISQSGFHGEKKMNTLVIFFNVCIDILKKCKEKEICDSVKLLARKLAFKMLESHAFDQYSVVVKISKEHALMERKEILIFWFLKLFFLAGGYRLKGTYFLRSTFIKNLHLSSKVKSYGIKEQ